MSKIFLLEPSKFDVSHLAEWGQVQYVYGPTDHRPSIWDERFVPSTIKRMEDMGFNPDRDHIAIVGHLVPIVMVTSALAQKYGPRVCALYFSSTTREYVERSLGVPT